LEIQERGEGERPGKEDNRRTTGKKADDSTQHFKTKQLHEATMDLSPITTLG